MSSEIQAYPLAWPAGWKRQNVRGRANFGRQNIEHKQWSDGSTSKWKTKAKLTIADSRDRLHRELTLLGATGVVISSNLRLRNDGQPMSGQREPDDPGICVYFRLNKLPRCLPCDKWDRAADNLAAIAKYVDALRGQLRWGVGSIDVAFAGFKALPGNEPIIPPQSMTVDEAAVYLAGHHGMALPTINQIKGTREPFEAAYRSCAKRMHPDAGGGSEEWRRLMVAVDVLKRHHGTR